MCSLLLRVRDKADRPGLTKRGDVVCVVPDGHVFSAVELASPDWVVVHVPDATEIDLCGFVAGEPATRPGEPLAALNARAIFIDVDELERRIGRRLDVSDAPPVTITAAQVAELKRYRPRVEGQQRDETWH